MNDEGAYIKRKKELDPVDLCCIACLGKCCGLTEMARANLVAEDRNNRDDILADYGSNSEAALSMRKEMVQITRTVRCISRYLLFLSFLYLFQTIYSFMYITPEDFDGPKSSVVLRDELYKYAVDIEMMKFVHALSYVILFMYMVAVSARYRMLKKHHYCQILGAAVVLGFLFYLPLVTILFVMFSDVLKYDEGNEVGMIFFGEWIATMFERTDMGLPGFLINVCTHVQIYVGLFVMSCLAGSMRSLIERQEKLKQKTTGDYAGLELNSSNRDMHFPPRVEQDKTESSKLLTACPEDIWSEFI